MTNKQDMSEIVQYFQDEFEKTVDKVIDESRRFKLAKAAMIGLMSNINLVKMLDIDHDDDVNLIAKASIKLADAMLIALKQTEEK